MKIVVGLFFWVLLFICLSISQLGTWLIVGTCMLSGISVLIAYLVVVNIAKILRKNAKYSAAIPFYHKAVKLSKILRFWKNASRIILMTKSKSDIEAALFDSLGFCYKQIGNYVKAIQFYEKAGSIIENTVGKQTEAYSAHLQNFALLYMDIGELRRARTLYKEALLIKQNKSGKQTESYAYTLNNLANLDQIEGKLEQAIHKYEQSLLIIKKTIGEKNHAYGTILHNLAWLYQNIGKLEKAIEKYEEALIITKKTVGEQTDSYATTLNNLSQLNVELGRFREAKSLSEQTLSILRNSVGKQSPLYANTLQNLAVLNKESGNFQEAEFLFKKALFVTKNSVGEQTIFYTQIIINLAFLNQNKKKFEESQDYFEKAIKIIKNIVGKQTKLYAIALNGLALLNREMGKLEEARQQHEEALLIIENTIGKQTKVFASILHDLAILETIENNLLKALSLFKEVEEIHLNIIEQVFIVSSDRQRLNYLQQNYYNLEVFLSFVWQYLPNHQEAILFAYDYVLRRKAIASETALKQNLAVLSGQYPHLADKLTQKRQLTEQIASLRLEDKPFVDKRAYLEELEQQKQQLEQELSRSIDFPLLSELEKANRHTVALKLPKTSTLIEFVRFRVFDFQNNQYLSSRYLAFILPAREEEKVTMIDLGETETIDQLVIDFRQDITKEEFIKPAIPTKGLNQNAQTIEQENNKKLKRNKKLRQLIFDKLKPYLTLELYIAPDSLLNIIPFEVLPTKDNCYLMDEYNFNYISVGRDILRFYINFNNKLSEPVIIANPDYDLKLEVKKSSSNFSFDPMPGTEVEGKKIGQLLDVIPITNVHALKSKVTKHPHTPHILHIATHGYSLDDISLPDQPLTSDISSLPLGSGTDLNPLLRSGLAFAGANTALNNEPLPPEAEDGILTAEDVTYLNLFGAELVVASACQTALGKIESGETITGFRRSFIQAGAKTLIVSLWKVSDVATAILMQRFYYYLLKKKLSKADSLKQAKLDVCNLTIADMKQEWLTPEVINWIGCYNILERRNLRKLSRKPDNYRPYEHPKYWSAFICLGNPAPIMRQPQSIA